MIFILFFVFLKFSKFVLYRLQSNASTHIGSHNEEVTDRLYQWHTVCLSTSIHVQHSHQNF